jgi:hypothetical protein
MHKLLVLMYVVRPLFCFFLHGTLPHCTTSYYNPAIYATRPIIMRMRMLQRAHVMFVLLAEKGMLATVYSFHKVRFFQQVFIILYYIDLDLNIL